MIHKFAELLFPAKKAARLEREARYKAAAEKIEAQRTRVAPSLTARNAVARERQLELASTLFFWRLICRR